MARQVALGEHVYTIVAQPGGYIDNVVMPAVEKTLEEGINTEGRITAAVRRQAYRLLSLLIPNLAAEHWFMGFASPEAYTSSAYDREQDSSPTDDQIIVAIKACVEANWGGLRPLVSAASQVLGPTLRKQLVDANLSLIDDLGQRPQLTPSSNGGSASTSPSTQNPTDPGSNGDSPSSEPVLSTPPTADVAA